MSDTALDVATGPLRPFYADWAGYNRRWIEGIRRALFPGGVTAIAGPGSLYTQLTGAAAPSSVEILVEQAVPASEIDPAAAKAEASTAEAELTKWGTTGSGAQDGDYANLVARAGWAQARVNASTRTAH